MDKEIVLITGATGFVGSHVSREIVATGKYKVLAIVRHINNYKNTNALSKDGVLLIRGLFYDDQVLEAIFNEHRVGYIIHLAALRGAGSGEESEYYKVNVLGTELLLEHALRSGIKKFLFCSTVGVYGTIPSKVPAGLSTPLAGDNAYHQSKISAEQRVLNYIAKGLDGYIIRPAIIYGLGDRGFPARLIDLVRRHHLLLPSRDIRIHLLFVQGLSNVINNIIEARHLKERIFIVADEEPISFSELVNRIHIHYNNNRYPRYYRIPTIIYHIASIFLRYVGNYKWESRAAWVSKDWHYDIEETKNSLNYLPFDTREEFIKNMSTLEQGC